MADLEKESSIRVGINTTVFDKYKPGIQKFFIQALTPTKPKSNNFANTNTSSNNIKNKDLGALNVKAPQVGSVLELEVPKDVSRWFECKFIPQGTRFLVSFEKITDPKIIGRDYVEEMGGYNSEETEASGGWKGIRM